MPLIVVCGHPCSGKSKIAERVAKAIQQDGRHVVTISEESLHLGRNDCYKGNRGVFSSFQENSG